MVRACSNLILFDMKNNPKLISKPNIRIYIGNDELEHKETVKYLSFYKLFFWGKQTSYANSKIRGPGILRKIRNYVQEKLLKQI